jgi:hypothetical protein
MQDQGGKRAGNRTLENRFPYGSELSFAGRWHTHQCFHGFYCLEPEKNEGKVERKNFANYFSLLFPEKF